MQARSLATNGDVSGGSEHPTVFLAVRTVLDHVLQADTTLWMPPLLTDWMYRPVSFWKVLPIVPIGPLYSQLAGPIPLPHIRRFQAQINEHRRTQKDVKRHEIWGVGRIL